MPALKVDLYSDTASKPTPGMRKAMAEAEVGDEQMNEDPSVNRLCARVAELLGKPAAVFMPSGTMCNQVAFRVWCQPGDEILMDRLAHPITSEAGGPAALSGALCTGLDGERGVFDAAQVKDAIRLRRRHNPRTAVLSVENTANRGGGRVWPLAKVAEVTKVAREAGLKTHMDGARLFNATVATGIAAKEYGKHFDSAWVDLSKGLGCPVGAVLAGDADFIDRAWRYKQQLGGAMRQAGVIAAAGLYALDHHIDRLAEDHANAKHFATAIAQLPGIKLDVSEVETNMIYFDVSGTGMTALEVRDKLLAKGVRIGASTERLMRACTHLDVGRADVELAARTLREVVVG